MGRIKWKFLTISLVAMILTLLMNPTQAYYTTVGKATNVVTSGEIQFVIHEKTSNGADFPKEGVFVMPGDVVGKRVYVENTCTHPFYLRVKLVYGIDAEDLPSEECLRLNINDEEWNYVDGWYYYRGVVAPGTVTPEVFSRVEIIGSKVDNAYLGKTLSITIDAQAVQSENNPVEGTATHTASGWPQKEGVGQ